MTPNGRHFSSFQIGYIVASAGAPMTGSERYFFDLVRELPKLGVATSGIVLGDVPPDDERMERIESFAPESGAGFIKRLGSLRRAVRREVAAADVIASHSSEHAWPVLDLLRRKPLVVHFHGPRALEYAAEGRSLTRVAFARAGELFTYRRAARFIALSQANAATLREVYGIDASRIRIIPGGVDTARFFPRGSKCDARRALDWPLDRPIVVAARRLAITKGIEELIDAVARLRVRVPDVFVALVGTGPLRAELETRVATLGLRDHVSFAGQLDERLPDAYRAADVTIVPSVALEGFGLSVLESLACGTAVLVTAVSGLPEVVRGLDPALVMPGIGPDDLATALSRALSNDASLPDAGACAAYAQRFAWPGIAARVADVYAEAIHDRRNVR